MRWSAICWRSPGSTRARWSLRLRLARSARDRRRGWSAPRAATARSRTSTIALPDDLPLVHADATLVEQAIGNIVGNAIRAYAAGQPRDDRRRHDAGFGRRCGSATTGRNRLPQHLPHVFETIHPQREGDRRIDRWRSRHRPGPGDCQGHHGGAWRRDPRRKPGCQRPRRALHVELSPAAERVA